jgi:hypothetical protein
MTTLPDDYARCYGRIDDQLKREGQVLMAACIYCLRRTAPMRDQPTWYMLPPEFTTTCPERIAP